MNSTHADWILSSRVAPFGNPRIKGYLLLPAAYRSLSRPSSAPDAKAFPLRSFQLDLVGRNYTPLTPAERLCLPSRVRAAPFFLLFRRNPLALGFRRNKETTSLRSLTPRCQRILVLLEELCRLHRLFEIVTLRPFQDGFPQFASLLPYLLLVSLFSFQGASSSSS